MSLFSRAMIPTGSKLPVVRRCVLSSEVSPEVKEQYSPWLWRVKYSLMSVVSLNCREFWNRNPIDMGVCCITKKNGCNYRVMAMESGILEFAV